MILEKMSMSSKPFISLTDYSPNIVARRGSLADNNPTLAEEWHPTKNGVLTPNDVTVNSSKRVWWQCHKDSRHEWEAPINSRNSGVGCPVCSGYKVIPGINDLATLRPDLAAQWHPKNNGNIKPYEVTCGTSKKVWWIGDCGHEWDAKIYNRVRGEDCPICAGKRILVGYNDLETQNPAVAREWHPTKNGNKSPKDYTKNSNKFAWWMCSKGHEWKSIIANRSKGQRCPICSAESKTSFPEQAIFYYFKNVTVARSRHMLDPRTEIDIFLPEINIGIEYDGRYFHKGEKAKEKEKIKNEKLQKLGILLFRVKEIKKNTEVYSNDNIIYCHEGPTDAELSDVIRELIERINLISALNLSVDVDVSRDRYKIYDQYIESEKERSILMVNPLLAKEWHPLKNGKLLPEYFAASSNKRVWWQCEKGHEWEAVINSRNSGVGCPYCANKITIIGENDLLTVNPKLAEQWHKTKNNFLTPQDVTANSNKKVWWQCEKGHEWEAIIYDRTNGTNCPICSGRQVLAGYNDLETINPDIAKEWHPTKNINLRSNEVTCGSDKKVWWKCDKGHEWEAVISSRNSGVKCPYCSGQKVLIGYNDLASVNPKLAEEWHPYKNDDLLPSNVTAGTNKKVWWLGKCGHEWEATVSSRNSGRNCPYCASQKILVGFNDLQTLNPKLAEEWHPIKNAELTPKDVMPGTNKKVWWKCDKGHEWENTVNSRNSGHGCPYCANQIVLQGYNDLVTLNPELALEWHPTKNGDSNPSDFMPGSNKKAWWICENGHEWEATISSRNKGHGCAICYRLNRKSEK